MQVNDIGPPDRERKMISVQGVEPGSIICSAGRDCWADDMHFAAERSERRRLMSNRHADAGPCRTAAIVGRQSEKAHRVYLSASVFPTRSGRFFDYENWGLVGALTEAVERGLLQLFRVDSVDEESFMTMASLPRRESTATSNRSVTYSTKLFP
jgi:hypothetical protein